MSQNQVVKGRATKVRDKDGVLSVVYHQTEVVRREPDGTVILDTGGYPTVTTKLRMNQASNQFDLGYRVYQKDFAWFVDHEGGVIEFCGTRLVFMPKTLDWERYKASSEA